MEEDQIPSLTEIKNKLQSLIAEVMKDTVLPDHFIQETTKMFAAMEYLDQAFTQLDEMLRNPQSGASTYNPPPEFPKDIDPYH